MKVHEAMRDNVHIIHPNQSIGDAAKLMAEHDLGVLPVGEKDRLVGMTTDRDIAVRAVAQDLGPGTKVADAMSGEVLYCFEDEDLSDVAANMGQNQVRRLPVLNREKRLVGIVAVCDVAKMEPTATTGRTVASISSPGGLHSQSAH